jgi:hypothetical protein
MFLGHDPPHFLGKMYVAVRRRFTLKWRGGCPDIVGRATRLLLYPSVSAAQGILPGGCASELRALMPGLAFCSVSHWKRAGMRECGRVGRCGRLSPRPSPGGRGTGLGDGSPGGLDAASSRHNDGMIHDGIIEIALFIPGHIFRLGMPVLICGPDANCMLPWPGVPVEVPSSPCL